MSVYSISQSGMMCLSDGVCVHLRQNHVLHGRLLQRKIARNNSKGVCERGRPDGGNGVDGDNWNIKKKNMKRLQCTTLSL